MKKGMFEMNQWILLDAASVRRRYGQPAADACTVCVDYRGPVFHYDSAAIEKAQKGRRNA